MEQDTVVISLELYNKYRDFYRAWHLSNGLVWRGREGVISRPRTEVEELQAKEKQELLNRIETLTDKVLELKSKNS